MSSAAHGEHRCGGRSFVAFLLVDPAGPTPRDRQRQQQTPHRGGRSEAAAESAWPARSASSRGPGTPRTPATARCATTHYRVATDAAHCPGPPRPAPVTPPATP